MKKVKIKHLRPSRFKEVSRFLECGIIGPRVWLGGGALQTLVSDDIELFDYDVFFNSEKDIQPTRDKLEDLGYNCVFECPLGELFTYKQDDEVKVQLITKFTYDSPRTMLRSFDFRATMFATDGKHLYYTPEAIRDTKRRIVQLNQVTFPVATLNRMIKYAKRKGFAIHPDALRTFVIDVNEMELDKDNMVLYVD